MKKLLMLGLTGIILTVFFSGCIDQPSQAEIQCEQAGGRWMHKNMPYACCCPRECLGMTIDEMTQNMDLCECCLRE